jgi:hypothetical protein
MDTFLPESSDKKVFQFKESDKSLGHCGNTGSNPVGDVIKIKGLQSLPFLLFFNLGEIGVILSFSQDYSKINNNN